MSSQRILITGLSSHWGGRLAQALEHDPEVQTIVGVDLEDPRHELQRTEFVRVQIDDVLLRRIIVAAAIDTVVDTRLIVDPLAASLEQRSRRQPDRHAQPDRRLQRRGLAGPQVRVQVFGAVLRLRSGRPGVLQRGDGPHAPAEDRDRARHRAGRGDARRAGGCPARDDRDDHADGRSRRPGGAWLAAGAAEPAGVPSILGFDPRWQFIHEDDVVGVLEHATRQDSRESTTRPATASSPSPRSSRCSASRCCRCCRLGGPCSRPLSCEGWVCGSQSRCSVSCASAGGSTTGS